MPLPEKILSLIPSAPPQRVDFARTCWFYEVARGILPEHVVDPDFWAHQAYKFKRNHLLEIVAADGSWEAVLRVLAVDSRGLWAQTRMVSYCPAEGIAVPGVERIEARSEDFALDQPDPDGYKVEFAGAHKFRIVRGNDIIESHIPTKAAAYAKLAEIKAEKVAA